MTLTATPAKIHSMPGDCAQGQTFNHILASLERQDKTMERLEGHSERSLRILEKMGENSATIEAHTLRLSEHDKAFIELFNWRREFTEKQDGDYRANVGRIAALEMAQAIETAVEHVKEKVEEKAEKVTETKKKFWTDVKVALIPYVIIGVFLFFYVMDRFNLATATSKLLKEMKG